MKWLWNTRVGVFYVLNLYQQLGGDSSLNEVVDLFYCKILADDRVNFFFGSAEFDGVDMEKQIQHQRAFMKMMMGGKSLYKGKNLEKPHKHLVEKGLNDAHFDVVMEHMNATLRELGIANAVIDKVMEQLQSLRDKILCREI